MKNEELDKILNDDKSDIDTELAKKRLYFVNEIVEWQLTQYIWTGCTDVELRDDIMSHATELIRQIIRKQGLHTIYPGQEESAFGDLLQTAWCQIERTLYKYRSKPYCRSCYNPDRPSDSLLYNPGIIEYGIKTFGEVIDMHNGVCPKCKSSLTDSPMIMPEQGRFGGSETMLFRGMSKVFNMWSQVARTVILAYIKKEGRDRRNSPTYKTHLSNKQKPSNDMLNRFLTEAIEICRFNDDYITIIKAVEELVTTDDRPHDGIIGKLVTITGLSRSTITSFMKHVKLRSFEFTDSPLSRSAETNNTDDRKKDNNTTNEFEDEQ